MRVTTRCIAAVAVLTACSGQSSHPGAAGASAATKTSGAVCPYVSTSAVASALGISHVVVAIQSPGAICAFGTAADPASETDDGLATVAPDSAADFNSHATTGLDHRLSSPTGVTVYCFCAPDVDAHVHVGSRYYHVHLLSADSPVTEKQAVTLAAALKR